MKGCLHSCINILYVCGLFQHGVDIWRHCFHAVIYLFPEMIIVSRYRYSDR